MGEKQRTAILFFTRSVAAEAAAKPLALGKRKAESQSLARTMIVQAQQVARETGLPVFTSSEIPQLGNSFGERLGNAFESVFSQGYEQVIAIGNDCLDLTSDRILAAAADLELQPHVLGPAVDGGVYLIGIARSGYEREAFVSLPWETDSLCESYLNWIELQGNEVVCLNMLRDIDSNADLLRYLNCLPKSNHLGQVLRQILFAPQIVGCSLPPSIYAYAPAVFSIRRGPPH